jgi:peptidoglycan/LPS O-acetylase OafA/YrhL
MKHYSFIDGLRAISVLPVILFHFRLFQVTGGYIGVDIFFVISGFLITGLILEQLQAGHFSLIHFYERRARRILPALFITCLLSTLLALWLFLPQETKLFSYSLEGVSLFASNFVFARWTGYFFQSSLTWPLLHTWSLAVEEQFYVLFPLLLIFLYRHPKGRTLIPFMIYGLFVVSFILSLFMAQDSPRQAFYLPSTRAWELLAGSILALHAKGIRLSKRTAECLSALSIFILLTCLFAYDTRTPFPGLAALPPCLAAVALLACNINNETVIRKILSSKPLVGAGLISYGLYLYHWPALIYTHYYADRFPSAAETFFLIAAIFLASSLSYLYVEKPIRDGVFFKRKPLFYFSGLGLALFGLTGLYILYAQGLPGRFSNDVLKYAKEAIVNHNTINQFPHACDNLQLPSAPDAQLCKFGASLKRPPDFLIWGDSHAVMLQAALNAKAIKNGKTVWSIAYSACPPLVSGYGQKSVVDVCPNDWNEASIKIIRDNKIKNVILISRWDVYALGWQRDSMETSAAPLLSFVTEDNKILTGKEAFKASFNKTMKRLHQMGVNIWVVKEVPQYAIDVPSALAKGRRLGRDLSSLQGNYADILRRQQFNESVFQEAATLYPLHFISMADKFCPQKDMCFVEQEGQSLYSDNTHLSLYGALWAQDSLDPFFKSIR